MTRDLLLNDIKSTLDEYIIKSFIDTKILCEAELRHYLVKFIDGLIIQNSRNSANWNYHIEVSLENNERPDIVFFWINKPELFLELKLYSHANHFNPVTVYEDVRKLNDYANKYKAAGLFYVVDTSQVNHEDEIVKEINEYRNKNITYKYINLLEYDFPLKEWIAYKKKIMKASQYSEEQW